MSKIDKKISIIGAGFSGLTLAYYLSKKGFDIDIYEKNSIPGGLLQTKCLDRGLIETAANGVLETELIKDLFQDINLPIIYANTESKKRYLFSNNRFQRWPLNILETLRLIYGMFLIKLKIGAPKENESVERWATKQFGKAASKKLVSPALQGIYAEDGSVLSSKLLFTRFFKKKRFKGGRTLVSAKEGMIQVAEYLIRYLKNKNTKFHFSSEIKKDHLEGPYVFAGSLQQAISFDPDLFKNYQLKTNNITTVTVFISGEAPLDGFGALFPRDQKICALGVLINNKIFNNRVKSGSSLNFIYKDIHLLSDNEIIDLIQDDCIKSFKEKLEITDYQISHWENALPVYDNNLEQFLNSGQHNKCEYYITGNYLGKLGLTGILENNYHLAEKIEEDLKNGNK